MGRGEGTNISSICFTNLNINVSNFQVNVHLLYRGPGQIRRQTGNDRDRKFELVMGAWLN